MRRSEYTRKTSLFGTFVAAVCILAYLAALVSVIASVSVALDERRADASREFLALVDRASATDADSFGSYSHIRTIQLALDESRVLEGVIVYGPGGPYGFERERGHALTWVNSEPQFRNRFAFSRQELFSWMQIPNAPNVSIEARAGALDLADLAGAIRRAMIIIAGALALAFLALLVESPERRRRRAAGYARAEADDSAEAEGTPARGEQPRPREGEREKREKPVAPHKPGNYSERGHVVRKEHTEGRLADEIERSSAAGQDIAFVAIEFKTPDADNYYSRIASDAARFFSNREFVCERGARGLSVICPGLTLDMGFLNATEFHSRVMGKYPVVFKHKTDLCMGVSARSGRDPITAARLVFEAEEALERALMDPASHVIAFKVDPDKYRAFMEGRKGAGL